jgi:hypothetical protein
MYLLLSAYPVFSENLPPLEEKETAQAVAGDFHDQGDAKWIVIRKSLWGHNDTPCGRPSPGRPIRRPGSVCPQGVMGGFSYYYLVMLISNIIF